MTELGDLNALAAVARASGKSASGLSEAVRRLETTLVVRLFCRTTRVPAPLRAFIDFVRASGLSGAPRAAKRRRAPASRNR